MIQFCSSTSSNEKKKIVSIASNELQLVMYPNKEDRKRFLNTTFDFVYKGYAQTKPLNVF